ncbi:MAG: hypothetical protein ACJ79V_19080 [Myxococcales bacterium]
MLVYGDHADEADPREVIADVSARVRRGDRENARIEAGRLVQGLLDAEQAAAGADDLTPLAESCARALAGLDLRALQRFALPSRVTMKLPEGYAFYAVYPELYTAAARRAPAALRPIGIRSIGTSLAAVLPGGERALSVRPIGHPFERRLELSARLRSELGRDRSYAIVDEGPGLSGSSFAAVAEALLERGVAPGDIHLFPSHGNGPGPRASERTRSLWQQLPKHVASFEEVLLPELPGWVADLTGPPIAPLQDLSGGAWRDGIFAADSRPPCNLQQERRKYLLRTERGAFLLKFAGLGAAGEAVLRRAQTIAGAGFAAEVLGLRRGFLVQRWIDARMAEVSVDEVASYIAFRSRALPAGDRTGAPAARLLEMAEHNSGFTLERFRDRIDDLARDMVRVETDNKLHAWEWLRAPDGRLFKTDGADHCRSHDLVGCMDPAWDLAGASFELGLDQEALWRRFREHGGRGAKPEVLAFLRPCYLAFQLGAHVLAAASNPGERTGLERAAERYRLLLREELRSVHR